MPELLLELFSEEIPARMQMQAAKDLERLLVGSLADNGLLFEAARVFAGPRRLTLSISGLPARQPDVSEERKGPRVGAPKQAIDGFLKANGLTLAQCEKRSDAKGDYYLAVIDRKGRPTAEVITEIIRSVMWKVPWPKSMTWGPKFGFGEGAYGEGPYGGAYVRWIRPLRSILCTLDGEPVEFMTAGIKAGNITYGHRFLAPAPITIKRFADYAEKLRAAHVVVDGAERREIIEEEAKQKAFALGLEVLPDKGLMSEVIGLVEWPVVLVGTIDKEYMDVPSEILQSTMRANQKYFALRDPATLKLANKFVVVAGTTAKDGGKEIVAGNERVLRARLADAKFFWDQDRKRTLDSRREDLAGVVFHAKLGTQLDRVKRIEVLAVEIAKTIGLKGKEIDKARRAAELCKADLTTGMVGEFPELQGVMGRYYALEDGEDKEVADAIRDHYKPLGPHDEVPTAPLSIAVALADKLDTLVGFFAIGEKPTGSGDPYALRRAALGVIRIALERGVRISLRRASKKIDYSLLGFFAERLKVTLREKGVRHDLIDAVFSLGHEDDLVRLVQRVEALQKFLKTDDGANLLVGYRRAANILKIEEKKDKRQYRAAPNAKALKQAEEKALASALAATQKEAIAALQKEDFAAAMRALAKLRAPVDRFFDKVTVNVDDKALRENRLKLLSQIVETAHRVADFSKIEG